MPEEFRPPEEMASQLIDFVAQATVRNTELPRALCAMPEGERRKVAEALNEACISGELTEGEELRLALLVNILGQSTLKLTVLERIMIKQEEPKKRYDGVTTDAVGGRHSSMSASQFLASDEIDLGRLQHAD